MSVLTDQQVYALARNAGLTKGRAVIAVAIAHPESGLDTDAHNAVPPDDSYGLWQINMIGPLGAERRLALGLKSNEELFDPRVNARAMAIVSGYGLNFTPWTGYKSGAYKQFLPQAEAAASAVEGGGQSMLSKIISDVVSNLTHGPVKTAQNIAGGNQPNYNPLDRISQAVTWLSTGHNWWRIAGVIGGGVLVIIALMAFLQPVAEQATRAIPVGRTLRAVS